jgi:hypothetical protein
MTRLTRTVEPKDWCISDVLGERQERLLNVPKPEGLLERAIAMAKTAITGLVLAVQPRIRLLRSFDQRQHNYPGYALLIESEASPFWVGVGPAAHAKYQFCAGGTFSAEVESVANPELETVDYYKAAKIQFKPGEP